MMILYHIQHKQEEGVIEMSAGQKGGGQKRGTEDVFKKLGLGEVEITSMGSEMTSWPLCIVAGGLNVDIQGFIGGRYRKGDSNPGIILKTMGGVGRNIAETMVRLHMPVELFTMLGESEEWNEIIHTVTQLGIGLSLCPRYGDLPIPTYVCIIERDGGLIGAVSDMRALDVLRAEHFERVVSVFDHAFCIVVDGNIPSECIEWLANRYGRLDVGKGGDGGFPQASSLTIDTNINEKSSSRPILVADPVSVAKAAKFRGCLGAFDAAKPNFQEAAAIAGLSDMPQSIENALVIIDHLKKQTLLPGEFYLSLGEEGMLVAKDENIELVPLPSPDLRPPQINRSGAGDAECAVIAWAEMVQRLYSILEPKHFLNLRPPLKARLALSAAMLKASEAAPASESLRMELLCESTGFWYPEAAEEAAHLAECCSKITAALQ